MSEATETEPTWEQELEAATTWEEAMYLRGQAYDDEKEEKALAKAISFAKDVWDLDKIADRIACNSYLVSSHRDALRMIFDAADNL